MSHHKQQQLDAVTNVSELNSPIPQTTNTAQRRQISVLFCDLVDSTALSVGLDPEDLRDVIHEYRQRCTQPIRQFEGHVQRFIGDGVLALFGYPVAHEDDAERALRAALGIVDLMEQLSVGAGQKGAVELKVRIGIATGPVVVGDIANEALDEKSAVMGDAPNLAARLQGIAAPNAVIIDLETRSLAADRFIYRDLGEIRLKGIDRLVRAYQALQERPTDRFEARGQDLGPLLGRDSEIHLLLKLWERAETSAGQVALVCGEPGIGKSRLVAEVRERTAGRAWAMGLEQPKAISFQCMPFYTNTAFNPIIRQLARLGGIERTDDNDVKLAKINALLDQGDLNDQTRHLLADLLSIELQGSQLPAIGPREKRQRTLEALETWFSALTERGPLLLIFEDLQWLDPSSNLLLARLVAWAKFHRTLILATLRTTASDTSRPRAAFESTATWLQEAHVTICSLPELREPEAQHLVLTTCKKHPLSPEMVQRIASKAEGNPLYLEELTKATLGLLEKGDGGRVGQDPLDTLTIPSTLNGSLLARLDQVGPALEVAQQAAVIGREFHLELLQSVSNLSQEHLRRGLETLVNAELIRRVPVTPQPTFLFKHALIQDAAYQSLLKRTRRELHGKIAKKLESEKGREASIADDVIAEHYARAGEQWNALTAWKRAAEAAFERSAQIEAVNLLEKALRTLSELPKNTEHQLVELNLTIQLAAALGSVRGYATQEAEREYLRARELCVALEEKSLRFNVEFGLMFSKFVKGEIASADELAKGLFKYAEHHPRKPLVDAFLANGMVQMIVGRFEAARSLFEKGITLTSPETDEPHYFTHGQNPGVFCRSYLAHALAFLGRSNEAETAVENNLTLARIRARDPSHIYTYVIALAFAARVHLLLGNGAAVNQVSQELIGISRSNHYAYFEAIGTIQQGWALANQGSLMLGIQQMRNGLQSLEGTGTGLGVPGFYVQLAELCVRQGDKTEATIALDKVLFSWVPGWDAEIERVRGEVFALPPGTDLKAAEAQFRRALEIARIQMARTFELRAAVSYAQLLRHQDRSNEAYDLLEKAIDAYSDGGDTPDLRTAKRLVTLLGREI